MKKKILLYIILFQISLFSLFSLESDWGGSLQTSIDASTEGGTSLSLKDSLSIWSEINVNTMLNFKVSGGYIFQYSNSVKHIPEFSTLHAYGSNGLISYKAGRFTLKDMNRNLFSTIVDGVEFGFKNDLVKFNSGVGFTGLIFNDNSSVLMTKSDFDLKNSDGFKLASPRLVEYVETAFFVLPGDGSFNVAILAQQDMLASSQIETNEGLLHTFYLNLGLKGRLWDFVFYNLYGIGELGLYDMTADNRSLILGAGAGGLNIDIPLPLPMKPLVSINLFYSSGDNWGRRDHQGSFMDAGKDYLYQFTPLSSQNRGYIYSISSGNLIYGDVAISISPEKNLSFALGSLTLFRAVDGPVSVLPVGEGYSSSSLFLGEELTFTMNLRPYSDLGFQVKSGVFIPNSPVVSGGVQYKISTYMSLSF